MNTRLYYFIWIILSLSMVQCIPAPEVDPGEINIDFKDENIRHVIVLADKQVKDSLLVFLKSESPTIRYYALKGIAAMKDSTLLDQVAVLLDDPIEQNQQLAAYTIGLMGSRAGEKYLLQAFSNTDTVSARRSTNEWILDALGRCGTKDVLHNLVNVTTYISQDTSLVNGRSKAIYRFALRKMEDPKSKALMLEVATDYNFPQVARLYAAAYLARSKNVKFNADESHRMLKVFAKASDEEKIFFAKALKRTIDSTSLILLKNKYSIESNPSVKSVILQSLEQLSYDTGKELFFEALMDKNPQLIEVASDWINKKGQRKDAFEYYRMARDTSFGSRAKIALLSAGLKYIYRLDTTGLRAINRQLRTAYGQSKNPYEQAQILHGLAEFPWDFRFIREESKKSEQKVVQVAGLEALDELLRSKNYLKSIGSYRKGLKRELLRFFVVGVESGDVGKRAAAAIALRNPDPEFHAMVLDTAIINRLQRAILGEPLDIESHNEILKTIAELKGIPYVPIKPFYNHPIDWFQLEGVQEEIKVEMATTKGVIKLALFPKNSPGTVSNFLKEAKRKYYNNKTFHRVVPGFVIQGGCPRGDGYGSLDYTIRSEFFPYNFDDTGYIGMASSGNHTEGVQFFITHTATPHLDGGYTIFGKVIEGMDVVNNIGVGDKILTINIEE